MLGRGPRAACGLDKLGPNQQPCETPFPRSCVPVSEFVDAQRKVLCRSLRFLLSATLGRSPHSQKALVSHTLPFQTPRPLQATPHPDLLRLPSITLGRGGHEGPPSASEVPAPACFPPVNPSPRVLAPAGPVFPTQAAPRSARSWSLQGSVPVRLPELTSAQEVTHAPRTSPNAKAEPTRGRAGTGSRPPRWGPDAATAPVRASIRSVREHADAPGAAAAGTAPRPGRLPGISNPKQAR